MCFCKKNTNQQNGQETTKPKTIIYSKATNQRKYKCSGYKNIEQQKHFGNQQYTTQNVQVPQYTTTQKVQVTIIHINT